jgi:hypothetical protein
MANELTNDYWTVTLPSNLDSSSARNPELFAYTAAQNRLGSPVLFSHKKISDLLDPSLKTKRKALERHHLFPRAWLERAGVDDLKRINQVGNFALLEWPDNLEISDESPAEYVPKIQPRFSPEEWSRMHEHHALPIGWHTMPYDSFLVERRKLMAAIIRQGFESLRAPRASTEVTAAPPRLPAFLIPPPAPNKPAPATAALSAASMATIRNLDEDDDDGDEPDADEDGGQELSPSLKLKLEYWSAFLAELARRGRYPTTRGPRASRSIGFGLGRTGFRLRTAMSRRDQSIGVGMALKSPHASRFFQLLRASADSIETELGTALDWEDRPENKHCYVGLKRACDPTDRTDWLQQHAWLAEKLEKLHAILVERVKRLPEPAVESTDSVIVS